MQIKTSFKPNTFQYITLILFLVIIPYATSLFLNKTFGTYF